VVAGNSLLTHEEQHAIREGNARRLLGL